MAIVELEGMDSREKSKRKHEWEVRCVHVGGGIVEQEDDF